MMVQDIVLSKAQQRQIEKQMGMHIKCTQPSVLDPISLSENTTLNGMVIHPGVLRPMSSKRLAAFLYQNRARLHGKTVIDIGSGCGLQGIVSALHGAKRVILSDLTAEAYENTRENVSRFGLDTKCEVRRGDLFENVPECASIVIFAQPYFPGKPDPRYPFTYGMLDDGGLIHRFFEQVKEHASECTLMCYLDLAGEVNNPRIQAPKHGFHVIEHDPEILTTGEQQGCFGVHELTHKVE